MKKKLVSILMAAGVKDILSACCSCMNKRVYFMVDRVSTSC